MQFSEQHLSAHRAYRAKGYRLDGLTAEQVAALSEDPAFDVEVREWREQQRQKQEAAAAEQRLLPAAPAAPAAPPVISNLVEFAEALGEETVAFVNKRLEPIDTQLVDLQVRLADVRAALADSETARVALEQRLAALEQWTAAATTDGES